MNHSLFIYFLITITFLFLWISPIESVVSATDAECNANLPTRATECTRLNLGDKTKRCCMFTYGVEAANTCHVVDISSYESMNKTAEEYKSTLSDTTGFTYDCLTKMENCLNVYSPQTKEDCQSIKQQNGNYCCWLKANNTDICYPVKYEEELTNIVKFANDYKTANYLKSKPSVLCGSETLQTFWNGVIVRFLIVFIIFYF